jgi:proteic killer suppression protein
MIQSFADEGTEDIFDGTSGKRARKACPAVLVGVAARKLDLLDAAVDLEDLRVPPGNRLEPLVGDRRGQYRIRINERYRICFLWKPQGAFDVEIVDYH